MSNVYGLSAILLSATLTLSACAPSSTEPTTPAKPRISQAVQNGFTDTFEKEFVDQCLTEQTSVNVDTKVYCFCLGSFVVRDNKAADFMPLWNAHLADNKTAEHEAAWLDFAAQAKKLRGCKIEKF